MLPGESVLRMSARSSWLLVSSKLSISLIFCTLLVTGLSWLTVMLLARNAWGHSPGPHGHCPPPPTRADLWPDRPLWFLLWLQGASQQQAAGNSEETRSTTHRSWRAPAHPGHTEMQAERERTGPWVPPLLRLRMGALGSHGFSLH